jgi:hypothetical protein
MAVETVVGTAEAARALTQGRAASFLRPFVFGDRSVAQAARTLDEPIQRVHYWVTRLVALGLLDHVRTVPRAGRPIRYYRAVAESYVLPADLLPEDLFARSEAERSAGMRRAIETAAPELVHGAGVRVSFTAGGDVNVDRILDRAPFAANASLYTWMTLALTPAGAQDLRHDLWELLQRYKAASGSGASHPYVIHVAMAPAP